MALSRRDFVKLCSGTVAGFGVPKCFTPPSTRPLPKRSPANVLPFSGFRGRVHGCSVTLLNSTHPSIADVLLKIISLEFHPTVMAAEGEGAV